MYANLQKRYNDQQFISYKLYKNALNRAIEKAKQNYYDNAIISNKNDPRKIWKTINELAKVKTKKVTTLSKLVTDKEQIAQELKNIANIVNEYFANVGAKISNPIPMLNEEVKAPRNNTSHSAPVKFLFSNSML